MQIPDGVQTITAEGRDLASAVAAAAQELGVEPTHVGHRLDLSHFRSATGASLARTTVRIIAWPSAEPVASAARTEPEGREPRPERREPRAERREPRPERREGRERDGRREREPRTDRPRTEDRPRVRPELRTAEAGTTPASDYAQAWFSTLLGLMDVEGSVTGTGSEERVHLEVRADRAGRIVGKRGATLGAIRHILGMAVEKRFGNLTIDVDVPDNRTEQERPREDRGARPSREDRGRDDRGRDRRRRRGRDEDEDRGETGRFPEAKLRALALRAAEKAIETKQTITINLELNSYDRRVVHMEISAIDGVDSHSEEREVQDAEGRMRTVKYIQVIPHAE